MKLEEFYQQFHSWVVHKGPNYLFGIIIFLLGLWFIQILKTRMRNRLHNREVNSALRPFSMSLTITGLYIALIFLVCTIIGFELTVFGTIIGAFSVAAGLALSGTLQNFAGGVLILLLKPFDIDDYVVDQVQEGKVKSIQLFYYELLTADNRTIIIPNGKLFNEVIVNVTRQQKRRVDIELKLGYIVDVDQVKDIINKAIKATPGIISKPDAPLIGVLALEIDGIKFTGGFGQRQMIISRLRSSCRKK